ncbi:hypothetical protein JB92DRAFT_1106543 [Gautieria morchelliformis]|nr:hypothetical protein JB92DRAFT_1106543 [Gautieria morchelliformis]
MSISISKLTTLPIAVTVVDDTLALVDELVRATNIKSGRHNTPLPPSFNVLHALLALVSPTTSHWPAHYTALALSGPHRTFTPSRHPSLTLYLPLQLLIDDIVTGAVELRTGATLKGVVDWRGVYDVPQAFEQARLHSQGKSSASSRIVVIPGALYMTVLLRWARWMIFPPAQRIRVRLDRLFDSRPAAFCA